MAEFILKPKPAEIGWGKFIAIMLIRHSIATVIIWTLFLVIIVGGSAGDFEMSNTARIFIYGYGFSIVKVIIASLYMRVMEAVILKEHTERSDNIHQKEFNVYTGISLVEI